MIYFLDSLEGYLKEIFCIMKPGSQVVFGAKAVAKNFDPSVYVNTNWGACMDCMESIGFNWFRQWSQGTIGWAVNLRPFDSKQTALKRSNHV